MAVDKATLEAHVRDAVGDDKELVEAMMKRLTADDALAAKFIGGYTRTADYTQKTQTLAEERKALATAEKQVKEQVALATQQLQDAETEKAKIMRDLAQQRISTATANSRLQSVKEAYGLSDDDIPPMTDLIDTRKSGKVIDNTPEMEDRLKALKEEIRAEVRKDMAETLIPELGGMASLPIVWGDITSQHRELTGKSLSAKEQQDILKTASAEKKSLVQVWEEKFDIPETRLKRRDEDTIKRERQKWEDEQTAKRSQEAMEGIRPSQEVVGVGRSSLLGRKFPVHSTEVIDSYAPASPAADGKQDSSHRLSSSANERQQMTGAERAAKRFLERRAAGVPMGGKEPERKSA
jgi:hypothetical protein